MHINQISPGSLFDQSRTNEVLFMEIRESKYIFRIPKRLKINEQSKISFGYKRTSRVTEFNAVLMLGKHIVKIQCTKHWIRAGMRLNLISSWFL